MQARFVHWGGPLAATFILVVLVVIASIIMTDRINDAEEAASFSRLASEADEFAESLELNMSTDRRQLELLAALAGDYMGVGTEALHDFLDSYRGAGTFFSRLELLLPDSTVLAPDGVTIDAHGALSFDELAAVGAHISDREVDLDGEDYVVRHFVPVERDGETVAILYGVIELGTLGAELPYSPYSGEAAVYVIDGATGDYLIDTWHDEPGNIWDGGSRPMAEGYDDATLRQGLIDGESNYVVFVSQTIGEYLYFYYRPLSINQWRVALSVPEDLVFSDARDIRQMLNTLLVLEAVAFLIYILWLIRYMRRETGEKQRQLDALNYIYDVEKLLFNAHEHRENVPRALEVISRMLPARRVAFTMVNSEGPSTDSGYLWEQGGETELGAYLLNSAEKLADYFADGHTEISLHSSQDVHELLPHAPEGMSDIASIPVEDTGGIIRGVLSASGLKSGSGCAAMLKSMSFSFAMFCGNARNYRAMQRRGERDILTGLYNRNRYELDISHVGAEATESLACVFLDVNGLHELNNTRGHEAGDDMLRAVADEIRTRFGSKYAYRLGGDEFVVFVIDQPESETAHHTQAIVSSLERVGYYVSAGYAMSAPPVHDPKVLIKLAESRMYAKKREYYRNPANSRRAR